MRRLVPVLLAGLLLVAGVVAPSPIAAAVPANPKIVLVVGATEAVTPTYRNYMNVVAATAARYSANVVKVYSPNATWAAVKAALQGASVVVYMGHGNGFPSPYRTSPNPDLQNGFDSTPSPARATTTTSTTASPTSAARSASPPTPS